MAKTKGNVIYASDLGKNLANGNAEIANYNVFAITVNANSNLFTFMYSRGSNAVFSAWSETNMSYWYSITITLSGNTFGVSGKRNTGFGGSAGATCSISRIEGIV